MRMKARYYILFITVFSLLFLDSCKKPAPVVYRGLPKEYTTAWEEIYGACYDSIAHAVVALDLYSDGLTLNANHRMEGTGHNLYISDIFVPDRSGADSLRLAPGVYHSERTAMPFTFLPGKKWDDQPTGMYILYIEEGKLQSVQMLDSGYLQVRDTTNGLTDLQFTLYYKNSFGSRATYKPHFQGYLHPWQKK